MCFVTVFWVHFLPKFPFRYILFLQDYLRIFAFYIPLNGWVNLVPGGKDTPLGGSVLSSTLTTSCTIKVMKKSNFFLCRSMYIKQKENCFSLPIPIHFQIQLHKKKIVFSRTDVMRKTSFYAEVGMLFHLLWFQAN